MGREKINTSLVDVVLAEKTLTATSAQDAWTLFCILRLRRNLSPGCHMRDFCAWWDEKKEREKCRIR